MKNSTSKSPQPKELDKTLLAVVLAAFAIRLVYVLFVAPPGFHGPDAPLYDKIAWRLLNDGTYMAEDHLGGMSYATRPPLFPVVLGGIYAIFGRGFIAMRILQCLLGAITCGMVFSLGRLAFNSRAGLLAAIGAAIFPQFIYYNGTLTTETLHVFLLTASLYFLYAAYKQEKNVGWWLMGGLLLGLAVLARSAMLGFAPVVGVWLMLAMKDKRRAVVRFAFVALGVFAAMSPWIIRNYRVFHKIVPTTTEGGYTFWVTNNDRATGGGHCYLPEDTSQFEGLNELEADRLFYKLGFEHVRENPGQTVQLLGAKFIRFWRLWPHASEVGTAQAVIGGVSFAPVLALALAAVVLAWDRRRDLLLFYLLIGYTTAIYTVFMAVTRYRMPIMPALLVLAGIAADQILRSLQHKNA